MLPLLQWLLQCMRWPAAAGCLLLAGGGTQGRQGGQGGTSHKRDPPGTRPHCRRRPPVISRAGQADGSRFDNPTNPDWRLPRGLAIWKEMGGGRARLPFLPALPTISAPPPSSSLLSLPYFCFLPPCRLAGSPHPISPVVFHPPSAKFHPATPLDADSRRHQPPPRLPPDPLVDPLSPETPGICCFGRGSFFVRPPLHIHHHVGEA